MHFIAFLGQFYNCRQGKLEMVGFGMMFAYVAAQNMSLSNSNPKWYGKIIGVHSASTAISKIISIQLYYTLLEMPRESEITNVRYNFPAYMMVQAVLFGLADFLCIVFIGHYRDNSQVVQTNIGADSQNGVHTTSAENDTNSGAPVRTANNDDATLWELLKNPKYNIYLYTFVIFACIDDFTYVNLTVSTKSLGLSQYDTYILALYFCASFICHILTGIVIDLVKPDTLLFLISMAATSMIASLLFLAAGDTLAVFLIGTLLMSIQLGAHWVIVPAQISHRFGLKHFGRNWGFPRLIQAVLGIPVLYMFGGLYEMFVEEGSIYCYGIQCVRYSYLILALVTAIVLAILVFKYFKSPKKSFGMMFAFVASQTMSLSNSNPKWYGKIIGVQSAAASISRIISIQLYYLILEIPRESESADVRYNFPAYMMVQAVLFGLADFLCIVFNGHYRDDSQVIQGDNGTDSRNGVDATSAENDTNSGVPARTTNTDDATLLELLKNPKYNIYLYTFVIFACIDDFTLSNLTISTKSLGLSQYDTYILALYYCAAFICNILTGIMIDLVKPDTLLFLISMAATSMIGSLLFLAAGDTLAVFLIGTLLMSIQLGAQWVIVPTEISHRFGLKHFGRNWGLPRLIQAVLDIPVLYMFGGLYEMFVEEGSIYCYGIQCVRYSYLILALVTAIVLAILVFKYFRSPNNK